MDKMVRLQLDALKHLTIASVLARYIADTANELDKAINKSAEALQATHDYYQRKHIDPPGGDNTDTDTSD